MEIEPADHEGSGRERKPSTIHILFAWGIHFITAAGAVGGLLAMIATVQRQWVLVFVWMGVSLAIDSIDGTLARLVKVNQVLPRFDGALLDNVADYVTYVVAPAFFLHEANLLPPQFSIPGAASILLVSGYQFCQSDAKTEEHYFKGFPSYWNITVFYLFILGLNQWINLGIILFLGILVFIPITYVYPSRAPRYQFLTLTLAAVWAALCAVILTQFPHPDLRLVGASLLFVVYYFGISLHLMLSPG